MLHNVTHIIKSEIYCENQIYGGNRWVFKHLLNDDTEFAVRIEVGNAIIAYWKYWWTTCYLYNELHTISSQEIWRRRIIKSIHWYTTCRRKLGNGEHLSFEAYKYKASNIFVITNYVTQRTCKLLPRNTFLST